jgi:hypothetical protein
MAYALPYFLAQLRSFFAAVKPSTLELNSPALSHGYALRQLRSSL